MLSQDEDLDEDDNCCRCWFVCFSFFVVVGDSVPLRKKKKIVGSAFMKRGRFSGGLSSRPTACFIMNCLACVGVGVLIWEMYSMSPRSSVGVMHQMNLLRCIQGAFKSPSGVFGV